MKRLIIALLLIASPALAQTQQQPNPATMQKAINILQGQRNSAMDQLASAQLQVSNLTDENTDLKAQIEELKKSKDQIK